MDYYQYIPLLIHSNTDVPRIRTQNYAMVVEIWAKLLIDQANHCIAMFAIVSWDSIVHSIFFSGLELLESFCNRVLMISANRNTKPNDCGANEYASLKYFVKDHAECQDMMWQPFKHPTHYLLRLLYHYDLRFSHASRLTLNWTSEAFRNVSPPAVNTTI
jgi:hypothetical protein